jgi:hypothetical protein
VGAACSSGARPREKRTATVLHVQGDATGTSHRRPDRLVGGAAFISDDVAMTAPASMAVLRLSNGELPRVDAGTSLRVGALVAFDEAMTSTPAALQLE